jgi:extracellular elastinolytic metalloproteinase
MMNFSARVRFCVLLMFLCFFGTISAQNAYTEQTSIALKYLTDHALDLGLSVDDVRDVRVTDAYQTKHNGVTHVYVQQQYAGIPVYNGLFSLNVDKNGKVWHVGHRFTQDLGKQVNTTLPSLSAIKALEIAKSAIGQSDLAMPSLLEKLSDKKWQFAGGALSRSSINVEAMYQTNDEGKYRLVWVAIIDKLKSNDIWYIGVDAQTGQIVQKQNTTVYCSVDKAKDQSKGLIPSAEDHSACAHTKITPKTVVATNKSVQKSAESEFTDGSSYKVFALPVESPTHGNQSVLVNPADPIASPFGWHDTNGATGGEYNYTRGNNVFAYLEETDDDLPPAIPTPLGGTVGAPLSFGFNYDLTLEPEANFEAGITNLFYVNNAIHDIMYTYGFDEKAGNFQTNNYGKGGAGNDAVFAEGLDEGGTDNANFATPADGSAPRMQMYKWNRSSEKVLNITEPAGIAAGYVAATTTWGKRVSTVPVSAKMVLMDDGTDIPTLGCNPSSTQNLTGKIVLIDRGICNFSEKAYWAQQRGAVGCIICNFEDKLPPLGAGNNAALVTIPLQALP